PVPTAGRRARARRVTSFGMYMPDAFRIDDRETAVAFMRRYTFATVVTAGRGGLEASHPPLMVRDAGPGEWPVLLGHMARANPRWRVMEDGGEVLVIFHAPHGYVPPSLYEVHPSVPTWSYQVVHAYGVPEVVHEPDQLETLVRDLIAQHETGTEGGWRPEWPEGDLAGRLEEVGGLRVPTGRRAGQCQ